MRRVLSLGFFRMKKGNVQELVFVMAVGIMFIISVLVAFKLNSALNDQIQNLTDMPDEAKDASRIVNERMPGAFDFGFMILFIGLYMVVLVSSWFIDSNPVFFVISLIVLILILVAIALLTNVNQEIVGNSAFSGIIDHFPIIYFVSTHLFKFAIVMGAGILMALYAKNRSGEVAG